MLSIADTTLEMIEWVFPEHAGGPGQIHGGRMMEWITKAGTLAASRVARGTVVLGAMDDIDFLHPVKVGQIAILRAGVEYVGTSSLEVGVRVFAEGPSGVFTADRRVRYRALLIAGGSGIAPIRALLEELPEGTAVIYRARTEDELVFREELEWLAAERGARVWYVLGGPDDPWPKRVLTQKGLRQLVPDVHRRDVYLCGPEGLVSTSVKTLRRLRVPRRQIHLDPFEF